MADRKLSRGIAAAYQKGREQIKVALIIRMGRRLDLTHDIS